MLNVLNDQYYYCGLDVCSKVTIIVNQNGIFRVLVFLK